MKILILSYANCANFGDRLGLNLLLPLLPPTALITFAPLPPFWAEPEGSFDLVIIGTGHSIFHQTLEPSFLDFIGRQSQVIGIFGLQYYELVNAERLRQLFSSLKCWFARSKQDISFAASTDCLQCPYLHLGDWLINAFPMTDWQTSGTLEILSSFKYCNEDLYQIIRDIQKFRRVFSARMHPLLCALTSSEAVKYQEQFAFGPEVASGKFQAMFLDITGTTKKPEEWIKVDRDDVKKYKLLTHGNAQLMRDYIWNLLGQDHHELQNTK